MIRFVYTQIFRLLSPYVIWRLLRRHRLAVPWREYFGHCPLPPDGEGPLVWLHAVSVGEATAAKELIRRLREDGCRLLLTHTTASGRDWLARNHPTATTAALPLDLPGAVRRFLRRARPTLGIILEAEYWPNLLLTAQAEGVRLMLANARLGAKNARQYRLAGGLFRRAIGCFDVITAQTARDAGRLRCFGARRVVTAGNLKFDLPIAAKKTWQRLSDKPTALLVATRPGEEALLLAAMDEKFRRQCFVILAPRHPSRREDIIALLRKHRLPFATRAANDAIGDETMVFLADAFGEMERWLAVSDAALIGGSFLPYGGQSPIEAMRAGRAAIIGPHVDNYANLTRRAKTAGALAQEATAAAAMDRLRQLALGENKGMGEKARAFCQREGGALEKNLAAARQLLSGAIKH